MTVSKSSAGKITEQLQEWHHGEDAGASDALLHLVRHEGLKASNVKKVTCPIAHYMIPIVCEPVSEKIRPATDWHGRISLQYSLAEALYHERLDGRGYAPDSLQNPAILALAEKIDYRIDADAPGHEQFKGWVIVETKDGRTLERVEMFNRGSSKLPMSADDIKDKFRDNASFMLKRDRIDDIVKRVDGLERMPKVGELVSLCCA